jgi:hypothetical protein
MILQNVIQLKDFLQLILTKRSSKFILYIGQHGKKNCSKLSIRNQTAL